MYIFPSFDKQFVLTHVQSKILHTSAVLHIYLNFFDIFVAAVVSNITVSFPHKSCSSQYLFFCIHLLKHVLHSFHTSFPLHLVILVLYANEAFVSNSHFALSEGICKSKTINLAP